MGVTFEDLSNQAGLKKLDEYLLTRSYITAYQASRDDLSVYVALKTAPPAELVNASRWYKHITALLDSSFPGQGVGVVIGGAPHTVSREFVPPAAGVSEVAAKSEAAHVPQTPPVAEKAAEEEDDDDMDLFGEETEEEKAAAAAREEAKKASTKKAVVGKSSVLLDVKPWDDETDMVKLEQIVRAVELPGLLWGASKLQTVVSGIKKLTIMMTIVDDLVSVDNLVEDYLLSEPANDYIQSCDIVAFNKI
eukprot:TRINITY_DN8894_c0_g1_i1.p1 TRINITY_DN8894_c0_g1~~TRINITY_DN8894_c0_g1_i1.p1  ORF type:complete len:266 (-),score=74.63 TRINITY_DN8894_c0_g1_i1:338-1084(-)